MKKFYIFLLASFISLMANAQQFRQADVEGLKDSDKVVYKLGSFLTDDDGMYYVSYQHICLSNNSKFVNKFNKFLNEIQTEDNDYFTLFAIDCAQVHFDKGEYSYIDLDLNRIPEGLHARFDVYFWSRSRGVGNELPPNSHYPYIYTSDGGETQKPTYFKWVQKPTNYSPIAAGINKQVPLGIQIGDDVDSDITLFNRVEFAEFNLFYVVGFELDSLYRDRGYFVIDESIRNQNARLYQFRRPAIGYLDRHLSTIAKVIVSIKKRELTNKCSHISENISFARGALQTERKYSPVIESLIKASADQNQDLYTHYFYETEQTLTNIINFIQNQSNVYGVEGDLFAEDLKAISVLKRNSCISGWDIDHIRKSTDEFTTVLTKCKELSQIGVIDYMLLDSLTKKIRNNSANHIPDSVLTDIKKLKTETETKRVKLEESKTELSEIVSVLQGDAKAACELAAGENAPKDEYYFNEKRLYDTDPSDNLRRAMHGDAHD